MKTASATSASGGSNDDSQSEPNCNLDRYSWLVQPCSVYKEELRVCQTRSYRKHHEFVYGSQPDCSQWELDHTNCLHQTEERAAFEALVLSEMRRRHARLRAMTGNNVWQYREQPPADWSKPLPLPAAQADKSAVSRDALDHRMLAAADDALEASFAQYGVVGQMSIGARISQCAIL